MTSEAGENLPEVVERHRGRVVAGLLREPWDGSAVGKMLCEADGDGVDVRAVYAAAVEAVGRERPGLECPGIEDVLGTRLPPGTGEMLTAAEVIALRADGVAASRRLKGRFLHLIWRSNSVGDRLESQSGEGPLQSRL